MFHTPDTLYLAVYTEAGLTACVGSLRKLDGAIETAVLDVAAPTPWEAVAQALEEGEVIRAQNLVILTQDRAWAQALGRGEAPAPDRTERQWFQYGKGRGNGEYLDVPYGGDPNQWTCIRLFHLAYWARGGRSLIVVVDEDKLRKARERWEEAQRNRR